MTLRYTWFSSAYHLLYIDLSDTLRPPGLDILVVLLAILGAVLVSIQPITSPLVASRAALDPTLLATVLFLAVRSSAGLATLIQGGVMSVYLSYPIPRATIALILFVSRVLIPATLILAVPMVTVVILLGPTLYKGLDLIFGMYISFVLQAMHYGSLFIVIAVRVKNQATSGLLSVAVYFTHIASRLALIGIGGAVGNEFLRKLGESMFLPEVVFQAYANADYEVWQLALVPGITILTLLYYLLHMTRRFDVS